MIFRIDDVNPNTDFKDFRTQLSFLRAKFNARFIVGINILSKKNSTESVYPDPPFRSRERHFFYDVDQIIDMNEIKNLYLDKDEICSHGLFHIDHAKLSRDAQEISILGSCNFLGAKKFIPPFNQFNQDTVDICERNGIEFVNNGGEIEWKSLESLPFDEKHKYWYYHPFRINHKTLEEKLSTVAL